MPTSMRDRLEDLVAIPSVSDNEAEIVDYLADVAHQPHCEVNRVGDELIVRVKGADERRAFIMNGHTDTVPGQVLNRDLPYKLYTDPDNEDHLVGLGTSDMKAGLAVMLDIVDYSATTKPPCDLLFLFSTNEETSGLGSERILDWLMKCGYLEQYNDIGGIILEPTNAGFIGIGHRGDTLWNVAAEGIGGHASQTFNEPPAIEKIGRFVAALPAIREAWTASFTDPVLGAPSINVTSLQGQGAANVVPSSAEAMFNLRVTPQLLAHLAEARSNLANAHGLTITQLWQPSPSVSDTQTSIYKTMQAVAPNMPFQAFPGATDKYTFDKHGIPMLIYGPGNPEAMHSAEEWVEESKLFICRSVIERAIGQYALR